MTIAAVSGLTTEDCNLQHYTAFWYFRFTYCYTGFWRLS